MKTPYFLMLMLVVATSCKEIEYTTPQPKGVAALDKIPTALRGTFVGYEDGQAKDTLRVTELGLESPSGKAALAPSDTLVYKYYKHTYFVSLREKDYSRYIVTVVTVEQNGNLIIHQMPTDERKFPALLKDVSSIVPLDTIVDDDTHYVIDPSPKQLMRMVHKGLFSEKKELKKISP